MHTTDIHEIGIKIAGASTMNFETPADIILILNRHFQTLNQLKYIITSKLQQNRYVHFNQFALAGLFIFITRIPYEFYFGRNKTSLSFGQFPDNSLYWIAKTVSRN